MQLGLSHAHMHTLTSTLAYSLDTHTHRSTDLTLEETLEITELTNVELDTEGERVCMRVCECVCL
jgi:hypothetical protein